MGNTNKSGFWKTENKGLHVSSNVGEVCPKARVPTSPDRAAHLGMVKTYFQYWGGKEPGPLYLPF